MARNSDRSSWALKPADLALLLVAAAFWPLSVLARNIVGIPHPERLVVLIVAVWGVAATICSAMVRAGFRHTVVVRSTFLAVVLLLSGGRLIGEMHPILAWVTWLAVVALASWLLSRIDNEAVVAPLFVALAVALSSGVVISLYTALSGLGNDETVRAAPITLELTDKPDMFVVVLDGYPGLVTLSDVYEEDKSALLENLGEAGFVTPVSAWSSYWATSGSVPSLLDMSYPITRPGGLATEQALYDMISGENRLVESLSAAGYETHMVESGWSGSSCGAEFENCTASPWLDEAMYLVIKDAMFGPALLAKLGHPFTLGTEHTMSWLLENASELSASEEPDLVFAHLVAPHDPFFLDSSCARTVAPEREPTVRRTNGFPHDARTGHFREQMACVDGFMVALAALIDPADVVVFVSDHGTAIDFQLEMPAEAWSRGQIVERMNVFAAVRLADGCSLVGPIMVPNLMRQVLSCLGSDPLPDLPLRMFLPPFAEIPPFDVGRIVWGQG